LLTVGKACADHPARLQGGIPAWPAPALPASGASMPTDKTIENPP